MTLNPILDRTSFASAAVSAAVHATIVFFLLVGIRTQAEEVFTLQEIALVPDTDLGAPGVGGFRELSRPGGDAGILPRVVIKDPGASDLVAPPKGEDKPPGPTLAERQKALKEKMQKIKDSTRREFLKKGGEVPDVAREEAEALSDEGSMTGGGGESSSVDPAESGAPAVSGLGKGEGGVVLSGGIASRGLRKSPLPDYPSWAREKGIEGIVALEITVLESGLIQPDAIRVIQTSGFRDMDLSVQQALRDWEFVPVSPGTGPQTGRIRFRFHLTSEK